MAASKNSTTTTQASRDALMDIEAVAARLGVTVRHVRRLVAERRIPYVKWSYLLRFDTDEIAGWLEQARCPVTERRSPGRSS